MLIISPKESFYDNYKACFCNNVWLFMNFIYIFFNQLKTSGGSGMGSTTNTDFTYREIIL